MSKQNCTSTRRAGRGRRIIESAYAHSARPSVQNKASSANSKFVKNDAQINAYRCVNSDTNHIQIMWKIINNPSIFVGFLPQIDQQLFQIEKNASLDRFRRQIAPRSAPGRSFSQGVPRRWRLFGRKGGDKGRFWDLPKSQNGSKIVLLCIDRRLDLPKTKNHVF